MTRTSKMEREKSHRTTGDENSANQVTMITVIGALPDAFPSSLHSMAGNAEVMSGDTLRVDGFVYGIRQSTLVVETTRQMRHFLTI